MGAKADNSKPQGEDVGDGRDILDIAEEEVSDLLRDLSGLKGRLKAAEAHSPDAKVRKTLADVRNTIREVLTERTKLHDLRKREAGIARDYAIDLESARSKIQDRLDRLRANRNSARISE